MRSFFLATFFLAILAGSAALAQFLNSMVSSSSPGVVITSISISCDPGCAYTSGAPSSTLIGTVSATVSSGSSVPTWSTSGTAGTQFTIAGTTLQTNSSTPTCTSATPLSLNIVATLLNGSSKSKAITVTCNPASVGTIACDVGPNATSVPPPAQLAGFTHCAGNLDFTSGVDPHGVNWQDANTFAHQCGARIGNAQELDFAVWHYNNPPGNGYVASNPDMPCAKIQTMAGQTDPTFGNKMFNNFFLACGWDPNPCETGYPPWAFASSLFWPMDFAGPNGKGMGQAMYVQLNARLDPVVTTWTAGAATINDFWQFDYGSNLSNGGEIDFYEIFGQYTSSSDTFAATSGQAGQGYNITLGPATTAYYMYATLITMDGSGNRSTCWYNSASGIASHTPGSPCQGSASANATSTDYLVEDRMMLACNGGYFGDHTPSGPPPVWTNSDGSADGPLPGPCWPAGTNIRHYIKDIQVWVCPNYWNAQCTGSLITGSMEPTRHFAWLGAFGDWLWRAIVGEAKADPFDHPWEGEWVCPDGTWKQHGNCKPPELGDKWWEACVPGRDDCMHSDSAFIGMNQGRAKRGGGYCYTRQPNTCSPMPPR